VSDSIKVDTKTEVAVTSKPTMVVGTPITTEVYKDQRNKVQVSPRSYQIVSQDIYTTKRNTKLEPWFEDQITDVLKGNGVIDSIDELKTAFENFKDGITKEVGYLDDGYTKLAYDLDVVKVSNDQVVAGIKTLDITRVTPDEAAAISDKVVSAFQTNGTGGAWVQKQVSALSNNIINTAKSISSVNAVMDTQSKYLKAISGSIDVLKAQVDGKVITHKGYHDVVSPDGTIKEDAKPYACWAPGEVCVEESGDDSSDTRAEHTGDTYLHVRIDDATNKDKIITVYRFIYDFEVETYAWSVLENDLASEAFQKALDAGYLADGKINSFYQAYPPTLAENPTLGAGDLWIDSSENGNNKMYRYDPDNTTCPEGLSGWCPIDDKRIQASVDFIQEATVDWQGNAKAVGSLVVKAGEYISGFVSSASSGPTDAGSTFAIFADRFSVGGYSGDGSLYDRAPFKIDNTGTEPQITFTGNVTFKSVNVGDLYDDGTYTNDAKAEAVYKDLYGYKDSNDEQVKIISTALNDGETGLANTYKTASDAALITGILGNGEDNKLIHTLTTDTESAIVNIARVEKDSVVETWYVGTLPVVTVKEGKKVVETSKPDATLSPYKDWLPIQEVTNAEGVVTTVGRKDTRMIHSGDTIVHYEIVDGKRKFVNDYRFGKALNQGIDSNYLDASGYGLFSVVDKRAELAHDQALAAGLTSDNKVNTFVQDKAPKDGDANIPVNFDGSYTLGDGDIWIDTTKVGEEKNDEGTIVKEGISKNLLSIYDEDKAVWNPLPVSADAIVNSFNWTNDAKANEAIKYFTELAPKVEVLEKQIDGVVETFYKDTFPVALNSDGVPNSTIPVTSVLPYSSWLPQEAVVDENGEVTTPAVLDTRKLHVGDTVVVYKTVVSEDESMSKEFLEDFKFANLGGYVEGETDSAGYAFIRVEGSLATVAHTLALQTAISADGKQLIFTDSKYTKTNPPKDTDAPEDSKGNRALSTGDIWYNVNEGNKLYVYAATGADPVTYMWKERIITPTALDLSAYKSSLQVESYVEGLALVSQSSLDTQLDKKIDMHFTTNVPFKPTSIASVSSSDTTLWGSPERNGDIWINAQVIYVKDIDGNNTTEVEYNIGMYKFTWVGTGNDNNEWAKIEDSTSLQAFIDAGSALKKIEDDITVFVKNEYNSKGKIQPPLAPYKLNDLWLVGNDVPYSNDVTVDKYNEEYKNAILICTRSKASLHTQSIDDWVSYINPLKSNEIIKLIGDGITTFKNTEVNNLINRIDSLEKQNDGRIDSFFYDYSPGTVITVTPSSFGDRRVLARPYVRYSPAPNPLVTPYKDWYSIDYNNRIGETVPITERLKHVGDTFTQLNTADNMVVEGSYKFTHHTTPSSDTDAEGFAWNILAEDSAAAQVLAGMITLEAVADGKLSMVSSASKLSYILRHKTTSATTTVPQDEYEEKYTTDTNYIVYDTRLTNIPDADFTEVSDGDLWLRSQDNATYRYDESAKQWTNISLTAKGIINAINGDNDTTTHVIDDTTINGNVIRTGTIVADHINTSTLSALSANLGIIKAGVMYDKSAVFNEDGTVNYSMKVDLTKGEIHIK